MFVAYEDTKHSKCQILELRSPASALFVRYDRFTADRAPCPGLSARRLAGPDTVTVRGIRPRSISREE